MDGCVIIIMIIMIMIDFLFDFLSWSVKTEGKEKEKITEGGGKKNPMFLAIRIRKDLKFSDAPEISIILSFSGAWSGRRRQ